MLASRIRLAINCLPYVGQMSRIYSRNVYSLTTGDHNHQTESYFEYGLSATNVYCLYDPEQPSRFLRTTLVVNVPKQ